MARKAKRDYVKGVYRMLYEYDDLNKFDLVFTHSLNNDPQGKGINCDFVLEQKIEWKDLKEKIKEHRITRAIWFGTREDDYVTPKDVISGRCAGVIVMKGDF